MSNIIKVPKPSRTAFNPERPLHKNLLIHAQVKHFKEIEEQLPEHLRTGIDTALVRTEGEASRYIRQVTSALHKSGGRVPQRVEKAG
jgi:hypothetical protein